MNISNAILATELPLPPISALGYEYVLAGNGLFIRAEDSRLEACIPIANVALHGLALVEPYARLKVDRVPASYLHSILASAIRHMPDEAMYQLRYSGAQHNAVQHTWQCSMPRQLASTIALTFEDASDAVIDLHSHNSMPAFFSTTDDQDEQGLRFYAVTGKINSVEREIAVRVGVYGHHWSVPAITLFDDKPGSLIGPFKDTYQSITEPSVPTEWSLDHLDRPLLTRCNWAVALTAWSKASEPQVAVEMIAADDFDDAEQAALQEAKHHWPEYKGYLNHQVAVIEI